MQQPGLTYLCICDYNCPSPVLINKGFSTCHQRAQAEKWDPISPLEDVNLEVNTLLTACPNCNNHSLRLKGLLFSGFSELTLTTTREVNGRGKKRSKIFKEGSPLDGVKNFQLGNEIHEYTSLVIIIKPTRMGKGKILNTLSPEGTELFPEYLPACKECGGCLDSYLIGEFEFYKPARCTHPVSFCRECLCEYLTIQVKSCNPERAFPANPTKIICPQRGCGVFIHPDDLNGMGSYYPQLVPVLVDFVAAIKQWEEKIRMLTQQEQQNVEFIKTNSLYRNCRACGQYIERNGGCNHITCKCSAEFCYVCLTTWRNCNH